MWLIEPVPAWVQGASELSRLTMAPKHQFADPALAARLRGATIEDLVRGALPARWRRGIRRCSAPCSSRSSR